MLMCSRPSDKSQAPIKSGLGQGDALERANDVVRPFGREETFVIARTEVPIRAFVIFVPVKAPNSADHDDAAHPVVPIVADIMKTEIGSGISAFETGVIVKHEFR